jgi:hypothetical protein
MTRVSVTNDGAAVVVVEVLVEVGAELVVVEVLVDAVAGVVVEVVVVAADATMTVEACVPGATDRDWSDPDEHDDITCNATNSAPDHARLVIVFGCSTWGDQNAAITVWELLALDEPADLCQELRDAAHHAVLRPDLGTDPFEWRTSHQFRGRIDR